MSTGEWHQTYRVGRELVLKLVGVTDILSDFVTHGSAKRQVEAQQQNPENFARASYNTILIEESLSVVTPNLRDFLWDFEENVIFPPTC